MCVHYNIEFFPCAQPTQPCHWVECGDVFVKLQPKPKPRLGVDFVFPLSQEEQEQEQEQQPHQNFNEGEVLEV